MSVCGALVSPTCCASNVTRVGDGSRIPTGTGVPFPDSGTECGLPLALLVIVSVPARAPVAMGVKVTSIVHVAPRPRVAGHAEVKPKSPEMPIARIASEPGPRLVTVSVCAGLVVLMVRSVNVSAAGVMSIEGGEGEPPAALNVVIPVESVRVSVPAVVLTGPCEFASAVPVTGPIAVVRP